MVEKSAANMEKRRQGAEILLLLAIIVGLAGKEENDLWHFLEISLL